MGADSIPPQVVSAQKSPGCIGLSTCIKKNVHDFGW